MAVVNTDLFDVIIGLRDVSECDFVFGLDLIICKYSVNGNFEGFVVSMGMARCMAMVIL